jgi:hypothetical protein
MKRTFAALCGLAFASLLTGCGNASDNLAFKAPAGFTAKASVLGMVQIWTSGTSADESMLMLTKLPVKKDVTSKDFAPIDLSSTAGLKNDKTTVDSSKQITICGNQAARLVTLTSQAAAPSGDKQQTPQHAKHVQMEMLMTNVGNNTYMAMYMHPKADKPDPAAEAALKTVCAKA